MAEHHEIYEQNADIYDNLVSHKSWIKLWLRFLFDSELSLFSRVVRSNRGGVQVKN